MGKKKFGTAYFIIIFGAVVVAQRFDCWPANFDDVGSNTARLVLFLRYILSRGVVNQVPLDGAKHAV